MASRRLPSAQPNADADQDIAAVSSANPHRSVNVQRVTTLKNQLITTGASLNNSRHLTLARLWSQCASATSYTSSVATAAIVDLVSKDALEWDDAFQGFENALTAAQGQSLANIVHALGGLFVKAAEDALEPTGKSKLASSRKRVFGVKNNRHPLIALVSTKPSVESILIAELDKILGHRPESAVYRIAVFEILAPFLDYCLLDQQKRTTIASTLIILWITKTLNGCLLDSDQQPLLVHLFEYLCSIPDRFPLDRSQPSTALMASIQALVDFYCLPATQLSLTKEYKEQLGGHLLMILLSWVTDMRRFGLSTFSLLQSLQTLLKEKKGYATPSLPFDTLWPLLSFILMNSPTLDEQTIIVELMHRTILNTKDTIQAITANLAFLPIFQVMGETQTEDISKKCSEVLQKLEMIPRTVSVQPQPPSGGIHSTGVSAMIYADVAHLCRNWEQDNSVTEGPRLSLGDESTFSSLIYTTAMFHPDEERRIQAITQLAEVEDGHLVTLVLFLYVLRVDSSPQVKLHLLQEAIPMLVTSKDEMVTARVLRTILTLINGVPNAPSGAKIMNTHMGAVGVRILFLIWKRQPRVWKTLRHVIHSWAESRPRLIKTPMKGDPEYDMEVAVLTTIRDICAYDATGYAEVLIPFLATLLGSVALYASSICIIIETMNLTVEANVVEPRAAWNVLLCHVAEHAMNIGHPGMIREMCRFYSIVGSRSEDTPVYLELREAILANYIKPLLSSENPDVLATGLKALGAFHATEIMDLLDVESPLIFIRKSILDAQEPMVVDEYSQILDKLVRYELLHMRRGLFKDVATKKATPDTLTGTQEIDRLNGVLSVVSYNLLQKWQTGDVNPGLRIGYALSSLLCSSVVEKLPSSKVMATTDAPTEDDSVQAIRARQSYRNVMTALTDVSLTDHIVERITALEGWTALFDNIWIPNDDAQTLIIAETLIGDLHKKLTDGYVPAHCANALFAITGIILSLHRHSHPASTVQGSLLAKHLLQNYVHPESLTEVGRSDEVQFAVLVSLSFITPLAAVDEKLVRQVLGVFTARLEEDSANPNTSSEITSWATFGTGWSLCNLLAGLVDSPTKTAELNEICHQTLAQLLAVLEINTASFTLTLGLFIAFSRLSSAIASSSPQKNKGKSEDSDVEAIQKIKDMARKDIESFLNDQQQVFSPQTLARFLGAPWVLAFSDRTESSPEDRKSDSALLDGALLAATSRRDLQPQLAHFTIPFCHMIHTNLDVRNPASSEISLFTGRIHSLVNLIKITPTSAARHTAVVALGSLFGIDWSRGAMVTSVGSHGLFSYLTASTNPIAMATVTNSALSTLIELSGLTISINSTPVPSETTSEPATPSANSFASVVPGFKAPSPKSMLMLQDLKAGRLAALVLGQVASLIHRLGHIDSGKIIGTSNEPKDYSRLAVSTSWLRGLWDGLWEPLQMGTAQKAQKTYKTSLELLLYTVHSLPTPLPAVNWFPLLNQLITFEPELLIPAIQLASRHSNTSTSLMEFLIMVMSGFKLDKDANSTSSLAFSAEELLVGEEGLGRILTLGGLPLISSENDQALAELDKVRGLDGLAKRVTLPCSRVVDLIEKLVGVLFSGQGKEQNSDLEVLQLVFLDTLSNHLQQYRQGRLAMVGGKKATASLTDDAKELLGDIRAVVLRLFHQTTFTDFGTAQRVLRRLADLSLTSVSHLEAAHVESSDIYAANAGARVLKEAIGISSLYRAGYLSSQQEGRMTQIAQTALLVVAALTGSEDPVGISNHELSKSAISVLLYAMEAGVDEGFKIASDSMEQNPRRRRQQEALKMTWLQRILDLLVLVSSQTLVFKAGVDFLLGGVVFLWWNGSELALHGLEGISGLNSLLVSDGGSGTKVSAVDAAEIDLLAMADDHEAQGDPQSRTGGSVDLDRHVVEDDVFELWHGRFLQSFSSDAPSSTAQRNGLDQDRRHEILGRMTLALPDIVVMDKAGSILASKESQTVNRLLRLSQDPNLQTEDREFLIALLRRVEVCVPRESSWILLQK
ncbi:hypothetical protein EMPS_09030 [Entomortierella parvispora]|uniref:DUF3730 domain-containing protein n=1 Tax=Entomortierella parvispora TaxID=205924 RepID=A0A9P3HHE2_9FUNG|nr:hypothetical protein EMPS_09030 [Entomortierella parvispora]